MTIEEFGRRWAAAEGHGKGKVITEMQEFYSYSKQTCYRKLTALGYKSGKRKRNDAGKSSMSEAALLVLAAMLQEGLRDNGKEQLKIPEARSIMAMNGFGIEVSNRQLARLLKQNQMNMKALRQPKPHSHLLSLHPNHVWQIDPSYCTMYYLRSGKQVIIENKELYKNKHELYEKLAKAKLKIWRYVCVDHYSGSIYCRYYNGNGENQENLFDFFLAACAKKEDNPFHGVPALLLVDKGSANTSRSMLVALSALAVKLETHQAGNSRAKGAVEKANDLVETTFEIRLKFEPLHSIEELNIAAHAYFIGWNANSLPQRDSRLRRANGSYVREELWLQITEKQLRLLPDMAVCRRLLVEPMQERKVSDDRTISYMQHAFAKEGGIYSLGHLSINVGDTVRVQAVAYQGQAILVCYQDNRGQEQQAMIDKPLSVDAAGRIANGPVIGEEYKIAADDQHEQNRKKLAELAHPQEYGGKKKNATPFRHLRGGKGLQSHNQIVAAVNQHRKKVLTVPKRGVQIALAPAQIYEREYNLVEALSKLKAMLEANGFRYPKECVQLVEERLQAGVLGEKVLLSLYLEITTEGEEDDYHIKKA